MFMKILIIAGPLLIMTCPSLPRYGVAGLKVPSSEFIPTWTMAFSLEGRQTWGIHGLLPPRIKTQEEMAEQSMRNLRRSEDPLNKYMYMVDLSERKLSNKVLSENTEDLMPIVYTPTVGLACQKFGLAFKRPKV